MATIFDIRVRALMQRYKSNGLAVWAFLRDAIADAPAEGLPTDETSMGVYADFFPIRVELLRDVIEYCVAVKLFARAQDGNLLPAEAPAASPRRQPAQTPVTQPQPRYDASASVSYAPRAAAMRNEGVVIASTPARPATPPPSPRFEQETPREPQETANPRPAQRVKPKHECYMDGNVCKTRPIGAPRGGNAPAAQPNEPPTINGITIQAPFYRGEGIPTPAQLDTQTAIKMCGWWNDATPDAEPVKVLTAPLAARLADFFNEFNGQGINPFEPFYDLCEAANARSRDRVADALPPLTLADALEIPIQETPEGAWAPTPEGEEISLDF